MGLDKNRCQDKLQLQKYTKRFVSSMDAETEKNGLKKIIRCPTDGKARKSRGGKRWKIGQ